jgi:DNA-binding CsgD family transcriptional regulator/tetratricopeptide (TPR) repeat protein
MERRLSSPQLSGRGHELGVLRQALERAEESGPGFVLIGGEAGVGKTRLVHEFASDAGAAGTMVLLGECVELTEGELPFAPIASALRPVIRECRDQLSERVGPRFGELSALLPELADAASTFEPVNPALDERLAQSRFFELVLSLLVALAEGRTLALVIDDLHWADRSSLDLLTFLSRSTIDTRLLLVGTYRSDELHRRQWLGPFVAEVRRGGGEGIDLEPLSRDEIGMMIRGILGGDVAEELIGRVYERSDGNPFFAEELLAASQGVSGELPASLRAALITRMERLSGSARETLRVIAVGQRPVDHELVAGLVPVSEKELIAGLRAAIGDHVLVERAGSYEFRHALVRETAYGDLLPSERTALHGAMARALAASDHTPNATLAAELAHHWLQAGELDQALSAAVQAGREAERLRAFAEAHRQFENALDLWDRVDPSGRPRDIDRVELITRAAQNGYLIGDVGPAASLARDAIASLGASADRRRLALLHERLGRYLWLQGEPDASEAAYRDAVALIPAQEPSAELAQVHGALAQVLMLRGRTREAAERSKHAIAIAREVGARAEEGHALITLGHVAAYLGDRESGIERLREGKRIAEELARPDDTLRGYVCLSDALDQDGRVPEAADLGLEGIAAADRLGARLYADFLTGEAAHRLYRLGRLEEAARLASLGGRQVRGDSGALVGNARAEVALALADLDAAERALAAAERELGAMRETMFFGDVAATRVALALARDDPEAATTAATEALDSIDGEYELVFYTGPIYAAGVRALADIALRARSRGRREAEREAAKRAAGLAARLRDHVGSDRWLVSPPPETVAHLAQVDAELSRMTDEPDPSRWHELAGRWQELGYLLHVAYAQMRAAEAIILGRGRRKQAEELLAAAATIAQRAGATQHLVAIEGLARRARIPLEPGPDERDSDLGRPAAVADEARLALASRGLTDREVEVLGLVAEGMTNRQIGEELFISEKTASVHVSHILGKLEVRRRVEAAAVAHRLGLVGDRPPR